MSEYQRYAWLSIDRPLTAKEQAAVNRLSSHMDEVTSTGAAVTYEWGDFKHDPSEVLTQYFDAFMYYANWGTQWLAFRFPKNLLDLAQIQPYLWQDEVTLEPAGKYLILTIAPQDEESYDYVDYEASLDTLAGARDEILHGDFRALYLAWLIAARLSGADEDQEPPVPPGLGDLSPAQSALARYFGLDPYLIEAAAETSARLEARREVRWPEMLRLVPAAEREEFLLRLAQDEPHLSVVLRRRLQELAGKGAAADSGERRRSLGELGARADSLRTEAKRREQKAAQARRKQELQALAAREPQAWREVDELARKKTQSAYDRAAALLRDLRELAASQGRLPEFQARLANLQEQYAKSKALQERLSKLR